MASLDVIALDPVTPQLRAPGVGDTYHFCRVVEFQDGTVTVPSITNVGDADTGIYWPADNAIAFTTAGVQRLSLGATTVFNEDGADVDFRVEGDTDANLLFVDASTDRIGVGTASPAFKLDVAGTGKVSALYLTAMTAGSGALYYTSTRLTLANYNVNGIINFETNGGASAGSIDAAQNWGIGTDTPNVRLDVNGAMRLRGSTSGYVGLQAAAVAGTTTYTLPSADGSNGQVLTTNGTGTLSWTTNAGGDVTGPASASDNAIARFDGATGKLIQNSTVFVDDDGDVGIGTSTPSEKLQIESGTPRIYINATTNSASAGMYARVKDGSGNADFSGILFEPTANIANRYISFSASNIGSDMAIVAGGNVGIGTITPASKLDVTGAFGTGTTAFTIYNSSAFSASNISRIDFRVNNSFGGNERVAAIWGLNPNAGANNGGALVFATSANGTATTPSERARIDSSGNLGLGVTPSAWGSIFRAVQVGTGGSIFGRSSANQDVVQVGANTFYDGANWKYIASLAASRYEQATGSHTWSTAASGTAGNNISWTEAMVLNSSGNLGIGTNSPTLKLDVNGSAKFAGNYVSFNDNGYIRTDAANILRFQPGSSGYEFRNSANSANLAVLDSSGNLGLGVTPSAWNGVFRALEGSASGAKGCAVIFNTSNQQTMVSANAYFDSAWKYGANGTAAYYSIETGTHKWFSAASGTAGNAITFTQAMTLDASGNLGIGTGSPLTRLHLSSSSATYIQITDEGDGASRIGQNGTALTFGVDLANGATERARITSGGLLLVNTTSGTSHVIRRDTSNTILTVTGNTSADSIYVNTVGSSGANLGAPAALYVQQSGSNSRSINTAGTVNTSGSDYAEYMVKAGDFVISKGDLCGIDAEGRLTNVFSNSVSFVVKSTNPSFVGGDTWASEDLAGKKPKDDVDLAKWHEKVEENRKRVDRIAFSGQVPVNVLGATPGQYIVPVDENGAIKGVAVSNPTFEQYQLAVGKVIAVQDDGRALIIVKVV